jgi:hypothetical protein
MTRSDLTHLYFLLDRSGSMQSIKSDIEGGFAAFIDEQRKGPGECLANLSQFDDVYEVVYADRPLADVPPLDLQPRNMTALHDAMGRLITDAGAKLAGLPEDQRPGTVIVAIMTDGLENASKEWNAPAIKSLVEVQTQQFSWEFLYMGADQDAVEVGVGLGISAANSITYAKGKAREAMAVSGGKISGLRSQRIVNPAAAMPAFTDEERRSLAE